MVLKKILLLQITERHQTRDLKTLRNNLPVVSFARNSF